MHGNVGPGIWDMVSQELILNRKIEIPSRDDPPRGKALAVSVTPVTQRLKGVASTRTFSFIRIF
jgi:hypothetical protein